MKHLTCVLGFSLAASFIPHSGHTAGKVTPIAAKLTCSTKSVRVELKTGANAVSAILPTSIASLKSGELKGCAAVTKLGKASAALVPAVKLKGLKSAAMISITLPSFENDIEFNRSYDWIALQRKNGSWVSGPVANAGGLEGSVENRVERASEKRVELVQTSTAVGSTSEAKVVYVKSGASWVNY